MSGRKPKKMDAELFHEAFDAFFCGEMTICQGAEHVGLSRKTFRERMVLLCDNGYLPRYMTIQDKRILLTGYNGGYGKYGEDEPEE